MRPGRWKPGVYFAVILAGLPAALAGAVPASAALSASLSSLDLTPAVSSHAPQTTTGSTVLTVTDDSGSGFGAGWHVTEQASALVYSGPNHGTDIPAANLSIVSVEDATASSGSQPVDPANGPIVPAIPPAGSLNTPRMVLHANAGYGSGTYTQGINLSLALPANTRAGTYTATITTTVAAGP